MLSVRLDPELEQRLASLAKRLGQTDSDLARELLEASLEDLEDIEVATARLENPGKVLTAEQAKAALGLDD